jgi:peptide/nickel transport system substrate-binding protein
MTLRHADQRAASLIAFSSDKLAQTDAPSTAANQSAEERMRNRPPCFVQIRSRLRKAGPLRAVLLSLVLVTLLSAACAAPGGPSSSPASGERVVAKKTMTVAMNDEPKKLGPVGPGGGSLQSSASTPFIYESFLIVLNDQGDPLPRLATEMPTIANGGWAVLPDGTMETTWKLRKDAFWHDGTPFSARDLAFTWEVWQDPLVEVSPDVLNQFIDRVQTPDDYTVVYRWKQPFAFIQQAGRRSIIPNHLLADTYAADREQFNNHRYNTFEYMGLGPYRLITWSPGSHLEFAAFDRYFLGRPKIDTIVARFITDANALAANLLAGAAEMNIPWGATMDVVSPVEQRWRQTNEGRVLIYPGPSLRFFTSQNRDEYQATPALKQPAVRQALHYALDKEALVELLYHDKGLLADSWYALTDPRRRQIADSITSYPYDTRRATQLLEQQGWRPASDGVMVNAAGERLETTLTGTNEAGDAIAAISAYWRQIGIPTREEVLSPAHTQDREYRAKYPGLEYTAHVPVRSFLNGRLRIAQIPSAANRWAGSNRNGLNDAGIDRLMAAFDATIDDSERTTTERQLVQRITSEALFGFLFFYPHQWLIRSNVSGTIPSKVASSIDDWPRVTWNVHEWDMS